MPLYQLGPFKLPDPNDPKWLNLVEINDVEMTTYEIPPTTISIYYRHGNGSADLLVDGVNLLSSTSEITTKEYHKYTNLVYDAVYERERQRKFNHIQGKLKWLKDE